MPVEGEKAKATTWVSLWQFVVGTTLRDKGMSDEIRETGPATRLL